MQFHTDNTAYCIDVHLGILLSQNHTSQTQTAAIILSVGHKLREINARTRLSNTN